jgi:hypothetical protein
VVEAVVDVDPDAAHRDRTADEAEGGVRSGSVTDACSLQSAHSSRSFFANHANRSTFETPTAATLRRHDAQPLG